MVPNVGSEVCADVLKGALSLLSVQGWVVAGGTALALFGIALTWSAVRRFKAPKTEDPVGVESEAA